MVCEGKKLGGKLANLFFSPKWHSSVYNHTHLSLSLHVTKHQDLALPAEKVHVRTIKYAGVPVKASEKKRKETVEQNLLKKKEKKNAILLVLFALSF